MDEQFRQNLAWGKSWEKAVGSWMQARGWSLLPTYDYSGSADDKAPKLQGSTEDLVVPDLLAFKQKVGRWVEVKWRAQAVVFRRTKTLVTGLISTRLWRHYQRVQDLTGIEVWLIFVQEQEGEVMGAPISRLASNPRVGPGVGPKSKEIFIPYDLLTRLASLDEIRALRAA